MRWLLAEESWELRPYGVLGSSYGPDRLKGDAHPGLPFQGERVGRGAAVSTRFLRGVTYVSYRRRPSASAGTLLENTLLHAHHERGKHYGPEQAYAALRCGSPVYGSLSPSPQFIPARMQASTNDPSVPGCHASM